jgi:signal transduction histidine kinase
MVSPLNQNTYILQFWNLIDSWFLSPSSKEVKYTHYKGRMLALVHLVFVAVIGATIVFSLTFNHHNDLNLLVASLVVFLLPSVFKKWGNFNISGNLLALALAIILVPMVLKTGGLYSDNLLWMIFCPMSVLLFSGKLNALPWLLGLLLFTGYLYHLDIQNPEKFQEQIARLGSVYYVVSFSLLFLVSYLNVMLFKSGEELIIEDLNNHKNVLETKRNELTQINAQLRQLSEQLKRSNQDLESFAYASSHDLKEPLRMIGIYTQLIQKKLSGQLTPETEEMMGFVKNGVSQMQRLLEDILEYSRVGRGMDKMKMIDLDDVLFFVRNNLKMVISETNTLISEEKELPLVFSRYSEMVQLFQNLISNAIKFRKPDESSKIIISWVELEHFIQITVTDEGIGIDPNFQNKIFELFEQLHGKHKFGGSGIGLATCKKVVSNLGGSIWLDTEYTNGAKFHFTLPKSADNYLKILAKPDANQTSDLVFINEAS